MIISNQGDINLSPFFTLSAFQTIDSTNIEARRLADLGANEGQLVWSLKQENGVGRRGRDWSSPAGNLYCSVLLRPNVSAVEGAKLSFMVAVALYEAITPCLPPSCRATLKWPNDILLNGKKTAGILLESKSNTHNRVDWLIIGTGVNIATYPTKTDGLPATSIKNEGGTAKLESVLERYCTNLLDLYDNWRASGFNFIRHEWLKRAGGIGDPVIVKLANESFNGIFKDLDESGALVLTMPDGSTRLVTAGEVFFS
ncbi:biotin--[acetyl-CoA-carboxylase] ligase [Sneathiella glossodoripedis]|uniref:biotin--[acetyl-CoA-carboxylase] ligase n=1 Tax=Sneathiella glossodoripedis TaxID=418853 RepID=UPI00046F0D93|nr:biotin--[acetyl-CoA-carboxylase] ligase [Sneathiella glossodoripedis]